MELFQLPYAVPKEIQDYLIVGSEILVLIKDTNGNSIFNNGIGAQYSLRTSEFIQWLKDNKMLQYGGGDNIDDMSFEEWLDNEDDIFSVVEAWALDKNCPQFEDATNYDTTQILSLYLNKIAKANDRADNYSFVSIQAKRKKQQESDYTNLVTFKTDAKSVNIWLSKPMQPQKI